METNLVDSLTRKLEDLELRVQAYHKEVVTDFRRYYHDLVREVNPAACSRIEQKINAVLPNYTTLYPDLKVLWHDSTGETPVPAVAFDQAAVRAGGVAPSPATFQPQIHPSGFGATAIDDQPELDPREELRHEREVEFRGLFTPTYLPLLDSTTHLTPVGSQSPSQSQGSGTTVLDSPKSFQLGSGDPGYSSRQATMQELPEHSRAHSHSNISLSAPAQQPVRPAAGRRATDDISISVRSENLDSGPPRSALRRSSTPGRTPTSPRRVRFEFEGLEVLPTSSPQATDLGAPRPRSPAPPSPEEDTSEVIADSILGPYEDDFEPPPKKVSSSDKLRALSRAPLDSGTVWTVVNPDSETSTPTRGSNSPGATTLEHDAGPLSPTRTHPQLPSSNRDSFDMAFISPSLETVKEHREEEEEEEMLHTELSESSDDEDFLAIAKAKSFSNKKAIQPEPSQIPNDSMNASSHSRDDEVASFEPASSDDMEPDEDVPFYFESGGLSAPPRPKPRPRVIEDEVLDDVAEVSPIRTAFPEPQLGMSPALSIQQRAQPSDPANSQAAFSASGHMPSVGSYKGRSVVMPVVKDPEVHARAASLNLSTFVGSLGGKTGMDEADISSYRASVGQGSFTGAPRSFTERMLMEEEHDMRRGTISGKGGL